MRIFSCLMLDWSNVMLNRVKFCWSHVDIGLWRGLDEVMRILSNAKLCLSYIQNFNTMQYITRWRLGRRHMSMELCAILLESKDLCTTCGVAAVAWILSRLENFGFKWTLYHIRLCRRRENISYCEIWFKLFADRRLFCMGFCPRRAFIKAGEVLKVTWMIYCMRFRRISVIVEPCEVLSKLCNYSNLYYYTRLCKRHVVIEP